MWKTPFKTQRVVEGLWIGLPCPSLNNQNQRALISLETQSQKLKKITWVVRARH